MTFGFHRSGRCWTFIPERRVYANRVFFTWWRFYVMVMAQQHSKVCGRCDGDGKAHGSDRPFEWHGPGTYPGPCPVCKGSGRI